MSDIVERLWFRGSALRPEQMGMYTRADILEAIAEIERLRRQNDALRRANDELHRRNRRYPHTR